MKAIFSTPYLVQRLEKVNNQIELSFEKGLIKKGLCEEVGAVFANIINFSYMGSAEFEYGALPKSLEYCIRYANDNDLIACEIEVISRKGKSASVYYICHKDIEESVVAWIRKASKEEQPRCKEEVRLMDSIDKIYCYNACGWYGLVNRFWFFTDRKMFLNVCKLFGV